MVQIYPFSPWAKILNVWHQLPIVMYLFSFIFHNLCILMYAEDTTSKA